MHECSERREEVEREERPTRRRSRVIDSWPWKAGEAVEIEREKERERAFSSRSLPLLPALLNPHSLSLSLLPSHPSLRTSCDAVTVPVPQSESSQYITPLSLSLSLSLVSVNRTIEYCLQPTILSCVLFATDRDWFCVLRYQRRQRAYRYDTYVLRKTGRVSLERPGRTERGRANWRPMESFEVPTTPTRRSHASAFPTLVNRLPLANPIRT